jgi:hypothetical protein
VPIISIETPNSSNIKRYTYTEETSVLLVEFKNGSRHAYERVPPQVIEEMRLTDSVGSFLHRRVKGYYDGRNVQ